MSTKNGFPKLLGGEIVYHAIFSLLKRIPTEHNPLSGLYEENGPPTDVADKISASFPNLFMSGLGYRSAKLIAEADK
jgi:hypothetical protein